MFSFFPFEELKEVRDCRIVYGVQRGFTIESIAAVAVCKLCGEASSPKKTLEDLSFWDLKHSTSCGRRR